MGAKVAQAMQRAKKLEQKQLEADADEIERDASAVATRRATRKRELEILTVIEDLPVTSPASRCMASSPRTSVPIH